MRVYPGDNSPVKIKQLGYILLLPVFFLLHNYNELFGVMPLSYLLAFGLFIYLFAGIVFVIAFLITRSVTVTAFITCCCLLCTLFFGAWQDLIKSIMPDTIFSRYWVLVPVVVVCAVGLIWYFNKKRHWLPGISTYLSLVVFILCGLDIVNFVLKYRQYKKDHNLIYPGRPICNNYVSCNLPDSSKPDIYFIVFDEYTDNRHLEKLWHYNNNQITQWLTEKGFYIPNRSKANYNFTPYSISSILNMNYFDASKGGYNGRMHQWFKGLSSMSDNETICLLQREHYDLQYFSPFNSTFNDLKIDHEFDQYVDKKLFNQTFPGRLIKDFASKYQHSSAIAYKKSDHDNRLIIDRIKSTVNPSANRLPQFVYGHLMITHKPHIYDTAGKVRTAADINRNKPLFDTYIDQVKQANRVIQELVTHILTHNKRNTLIMVMGDHGFRDLPNEPASWLFPNFSAFYFPGKNPDPALTNISAVNTFRIVFNQYFCQNLPLLKDSSILVKY